MSRFSVPGPDPATLLLESSANTPSSLRSDGHSGETPSTKSITRSSLGPVRSIVFAPFSGALAAGMALGAPLPAGLDLAPFALERFAAGEQPCRELAAVDRLPPVEARRIVTTDALIAVMAWQERAIIVTEIGRDVPAKSVKLRLLRP